MKKSHKESISSFALSIISVIIYMIILIPPAIIVITSFTSQSIPTLPNNIDLRWYDALLQDDQLIGALVNSIIVATFSTLLAVVIGICTALGYVKSEFKYKNSISTLMILPIMISPVITGIAIVRYASILDISSNYLILILAHSVLVLPYVFLLIRAELVTFDIEYEQASRILGANSIQTMLNVTLPNIFPAIVSAYTIGFVVSFGEFTATQFLVSPGTTTVPVIIYTMLREGLTPVISSLSTVLIILMLVGGILSSILGSGN